jgi:MoaA/NifB/PqqE/SkfB family radical SAM enzyme
MKTKKTDYTTSVIKEDKLKFLKEAAGEAAYDSYRKEWEMSEAMAHVPAYPIQLDFELNYSCNFTCSNCTWNVESTGGKGKSTWFPFEEYKKIIDNGVQQGLKAIRLNYINEPLIRKDLFEFIKYAKNAGILDIYFSTNGSLLTNKIGKSLIESGLTRLQVSLDAFTEETFNTMRQGGNFSQVKDNIFKFIKQRESMGSNLPLLRVNFVRTSQNENELEDFRSYWTENADGIGIQDLVGIMKDFEEKAAGSTTPAATSIAFKCTQPFNHLTIRYDGSILPCCSFFGAQLPIGRVKTNSKLSRIKNINNEVIDIKPVNSVELTIEDAWNSPDIRFLRDIHSKGEYFRHPVCKRCVESSSHNDNTRD